MTGSYGDEQLVLLCHIVQDLRLSSTRSLKEQDEVNSSNDKGEPIDYEPDLPPCIPVTEPYSLSVISSVHCLSIFDLLVICSKPVISFSRHILLEHT